MVTSMETGRSLYRRAVVGAVAGLLSGILPGLAARGAMALMTMGANGTPVFSAGGTGAIVVFGSLIGAFLGLSYGLLNQWESIGGSVPGVLKFGAAVFVVFVIPYALNQPQGTLIEVQLIPQLVYYLIPFLFALLLIPIYRWLNPLYPDPDWKGHPWRTALAYGAGGFLAGIGLLIGWVVLSAGLSNLIRTVGIPITMTFRGRSPDLTPMLFAGVVLLITYPGTLAGSFLVLLRFMKPERLLWRGLITGLLLAVLLAGPAYLMARSQFPDTSTWHEIAAWGGGLFALAFILGGGNAGLMFARQQDKESTLLPAGILGLASISVAAFVVLVVANLQ